MTTTQTLHGQPFITAADLRRLSESIAEHGIAGLGSDLPLMVSAARAAHAPAILPEVLASAGEPEVVRIRAFIKLGLFLTSMAPAASQ